MTDEAAILAAIAAHPAEDTPRLAYADWLDEHGDAAARIRAEFIRVQCETYKLDRLPSLDRLPPVDMKPHVPLYQRQHVILEEHRHDLLGSLAADTSHFDTVFDRGFLAELTLEADVFLRHADTIAAYKPLPRVVVSNGAANLWKLAFSGHTDLITSLVMQSTERQDAIPLTFTQVHSELCDVLWNRLMVLDLAGCRIGDTLDHDAVLVFVNNSSSFPILDDLDLSGNEISDDGVQLLVESPLWPRLRRLVLGGNPAISDVGAETLAGAAATSRLENLNLRFTGIGLDGVRELSRAYGGRADVF